MPEHSNVYYKRTNDGIYTPCKNAVGVKNNAGVDLFRENGVIYEGSTGASIGNESRLNELLDGINKDSEKFKANIQKFIDSHGLSPRYTQPEVKKDDLFPRDESRKLMNVLYHKEKCWFTKIENVNFQSEFDLYLMDKEKSDYGKGIYIPCNGWMIKIDWADNFEKALEFLRQPGFDLYNHIVERFENELANPQKWADFGIAEFLGRVEEAKAHNQPIKEMRDAENRKRTEKIEAERRNREEKAAAVYTTAMSGAEQSILDRKPVVNKDIGDKDLLLQLFRENGIELPLKTQGWVKTSLAEIYPKTNNNKWSYRYCGNPSTVITDYINKLVEAVTAKHQNLETVKSIASEQSKDKTSILGAITENKNAIAANDKTNADNRDKKVQTEL